ncbi:hypothetical protein BX666DRAFT_1858863, partial [Dichotomocladium elegans]
RLARRSDWTRCPGCQIMISKMDGCNTIKCRCGTELCYRCGSYSTNHVCTIHCETLSRAELAAYRQAMFTYPSAPETSNTVPMN